MPDPVKPHETQTVGFLDIGTNSMRLLVARIESDGSYAVLSEQKESIRLGDGEFLTQTIQPDVMAKTILVGARFVEMARSFDAEKIIAVATSATRDARNRQELLDRFREVSGVEVRVISGREEARLIYIGVISGAHLDGQKALIIDIGGGSTEVIVGDQHRHEYLDTMKMGAIRLTNHFFPAGDTGAVSRTRYETIRQHVRSTAIRPVQKLSQLNFDMTLGASGTILALGDIAARRFFGRPLEKNDTFLHPQIHKVITDLCDLKLSERLKVPGMNPRRADIIIAGAAILDVLMEALNIPSITVSERALRHGLLLDHFTRSDPRSVPDEFSYRMDSVIRLGRRCRFHEEHARHVARLALELFDSTLDSGLHALGPADRALLEYAALLHDIGAFLSYTNHRRHSYYFIRHAELLGFDDTELAVLATTALFHKKTYPRKKHPEFAALPPRNQSVVRVLCVLLRIAESLDRSHAKAVHHARVIRRDAETATLAIATDPSAHLEQWAVVVHTESFARTFGIDLVVQVVAPGAFTAILAEH